MPFQSDSRYGGFYIQLNTSTICEELEDLLDKEYVCDINEGSVFWNYVYHLENEFNGSFNKNCRLHFWEWFIDNYNNIYAWEHIVDNFWEEVEEEEEEEEEVEEEEEEEEEVDN
jgi:hypothetical protein